MDILGKINKGVGVAATAMIIAGGTPQIVKAMTNPENTPKIEAKQLCKDIEKSIKDGTYKVNPRFNMNTSSENKSELIAKVEIKTLKAENDEPSMSGTYLKKEARYIKENGKIYCEIDVLALDWMKNISVEVDSKKVQHTQKETGKAKIMGMDHTGGVIKFEVPKVDSKLTFHMYVVPMSSNVTFRVVGEKVTTVTKPKKSTELDVKPNPKPSKLDMKPEQSKEEHNPQTKPTKSEDKKTLEKDKEKPKETQKPVIKPDEAKPTSPEPKSIEDKQESKKTVVKIKTLKAETDEPSMAETYLKKEARYIKENGKIYCEIDVLALDWMKNIFVEVDSKKVQHTQKETGKAKIMGMDHTGGVIKFEVPKVDSKLTFHMYVVPMSSNVTFRIVEDKSVIAEKPTKPTTKPNNDTAKPAKPENKAEDKKEVTKNIKVKALKEKSNEPSMAEEYLDKNIVYTDKNGKKYFTLTVNRIDWMKNISVSVDGKKDLHYDKKEIGNTAELTFEVGSENSEVTLHMNVVPMGNAKVAFRVVKEGTNTKTEPKSESAKKDKRDDKKEKEKEKDKLKINANEEGMYRVNIDTFKKDSDEKSMAGQYLKSTANYEVKNGTKYITLTLNRMDWMKNVTVYVNGDKKKYEEKSIGNNRSEIRFETDGIGAEIKLEMNVVPMSNARVTFRVVPRKSSLELIKKYNSNTDKTSNKSDSEQDDKESNKKNNKIDTNKNENKDDNKENQKDNITKSDPKNEEHKKDTTEKPSEKVATESNEDKDGLYEVDIKALKENNKELSMAGTYIGDNIKVQMKNGKKYAIVTFNRSDWMKDIDVLINNKSEKYDVINIKTNNVGEKTSTIKFEIPNLDSEIKFKMNVEPMGNARVTFRVLMKKDSIKFLEGTKYNPNKAEEYLNNLANESKENKDSKGSLRNYDDNNNQNQSTILKKKLPKTGLPFGGGLLASIGGILSGLGITLMKKNKKRGE
ncbi:hypothetical protein AXF41_03255 [Clostridium haemolyticum]|uniref:NEAT domain-containing protein n=1 Tax=Clostridium haemolyticum TaxID=84025 RepID=UPI0009D525B7|nr:NEAT domain-containing protein [Clostridium haemolyticum]OOB76360.1 hypothetical protein AXF41_03255 [Clostridium haemolyticum]